MFEDEQAALFTVYFKSYMFRDNYTKVSVHIIRRLNIELLLFVSWSFILTGRFL